ncbi:hypothetical protein [Salibacter halophilus]|uniref:DUF4837 family protein n=1 Tax=Salibacter halophilus TaxID=1803916 RepID=A0A6N6MAW3_9FLAO|nr:hypothetical protein [Salibacter halophilus]KAB1065587.1 hypothetical protein F3059_02735 [Salibacter halophilus]
MKKLILTLTLIFSLSAAYSQDARQYQQIVRMTPTLSEGIDDQLFAPNAKVALVTVIPSTFSMEPEKGSESVANILIEQLKNDLQSMGVNVEYTLHEPVRTSFGNVEGVNKLTKSLHENDINYLVQVGYPAWAKKSKALKKDDFFVTMSEYRGIPLDDKYMAYYPINGDEYDAGAKAIFGSLDDIKSKLKEASNSAPKEEANFKGYIVDEPIEIKIENGIPENLSSRTLHQIDYSDYTSRLGGKKYEKLMEAFDELAEDGYVAETKSFDLNGDRSDVELATAFVSGLSTITKFSTSHKTFGRTDVSTKLTFYFFLIDYKTNTYYLAFSDKNKLNEPVMADIKKAGENLAERIERLSDK